MDVNAVMAVLPRVSNACADRAGNNEMDPADLCVAVGGGGVFFVNEVGAFDYPQS